MELERRIKVVCIDASNVLEWFISGLRPPVYVRLPVIEGVPNDAKVLSVREDIYGRYFRFLISHPSFDEVADGDMIPDLTGPSVRYESLEIRGPKQDSGPFIV